MAFPGVGPLGSRGPSGFRGITLVEPWKSLMYPGKIQIPQSRTVDDINPALPIINKEYTLIPIV